MTQDVRVTTPNNLINSKACELMSLERVLLVLRHDMECAGYDWRKIKMSTGNTFSDDTYAYYIVINSWLNLASDIAGEKAARSLSALIQVQGLISVIEDAQQIAGSLRTNEDAWSMDHVELTNSGLWSNVLDYVTVDVVQMLQLLNYPKRFSCPFRSEVIAGDSYAKFLEINKRHSEWARNRKIAEYVTSQHRQALLIHNRLLAAFTHTGLSSDIGAYAFAMKSKYRDGQQVYAKGVPDLPDYWLTEIREAMYDLYHGSIERPCKKRPLLTNMIGGWPFATIDDSSKVAPYSYNVGDGDYGYFSNGTTAEGYKNGISKRLAYLAANPRYLGYTVGRNDPILPISESRILCVPKTYKASRIIAEEYSYTAFAEQAVNKYIQQRLERQLKASYTRRYDNSDQERNRRLAVAGSANGKFATIDLSGASDSIGRAFYRLVAPKDVALLVLGHASSYIRVRGKRIKCHILLTSGTGLTFNNESNTFLPIAIACERVHKRWTNETVAPSIVYGDDLVVDIRIFSLFCEVLAKCGFVVNEDKSFADGTRYRESCGIEAFGGYQFQLNYYPRSGIRLSDPVLAVVQLTELQKKFFWHYPMTSQFFRAFVLDMCPAMTYSPAGTECDDLWGSDSLNPIIYPPHIYEGKVVTSADGIPEEIRQTVARKQHVTLKAYPDLQAYNEVMAGLSPEVISSLEKMRYVEELRDLATRSEDHEVYGGIELPYMRDKSGKVTAYGFTTPRLVLS